MTNRRKDGQTEPLLGIARFNTDRRALKVLLVTVTRSVKKITRYCIVVVTCNELLPNTAGL